MKDHVKQENRKALPKFFLLLLGGAVLGGVLGFLAGWMGAGGLKELVEERLTALVAHVLPWAIPAVSLVLLALAVWRYLRAKRLFAAWNGEDEAPMEQAEEHLNWALLLNGVALVLAFFLMSASGYTGRPGGALAVTLCFLVLAAAVVVIQQKVVDLTRRMNPEKQGSVYDVRFRRKWLDSCDEAERAQIGQAAYRAYAVTGSLCLVLWVALLVLDMVFGFGLLPAFVVLLVWGVMQVVYCWECIRMDRRKNS